MKRIGFAVFLLLGAGCASRDYYTTAGDHCHTTQFSNLYFNKTCRKGERTGNLNLNLNQPQHDPKVSPSH